MTSIPIERQRENFDPCTACIRLGTGLRRAGKLQESEATLQLALSYEPDSLEALIALAHVLHRRDCQDDADAVVDRIVRLDPDGATTPLRESLLLASVDLAELLRARERSAQADAIIEQIMALEPANMAMNRQFSMLLLRCGDFKHGWQEWDRQVVPFKQPAWDGSPLSSKTILVQALHGYGDVIQFVRLLPHVKERGAHIILEHQPALETLLQGTEGCWDTLVARHTGQEALDIDFDVHIPLMRLPVPLGIEDRIPAAVPYLRPDPVRVQHWRERLAADHGCRVGLVWAGNPRAQGDRFRSCALADYAWLARLPQIRYYSLQKGPAAEQVGTAAAAKLGLTDLGPELHDWADTAAVIMNLDLVITVDTAVAHLAGALGRPVWTLLPRHACWRWLEEREDSPWYPTMRLFRQSRQGDWSAVLQQLIRELDLFRRR